MGGRCELRVSPSTPSAPDRNVAVVLAGQVCKSFTRRPVDDNRSAGHVHDAVIGIGTVLISSASRHAVSGTDPVFQGEMMEGLQIGANSDDDITTPASVSAVRTSPGHVLLVPKRDSTGPAFSRAKRYVNFIDETQHTRRLTYGFVMSLVSQSGRSS
jgi:hypothetical protein